MRDALVLVPALPLAGFLILFLSMGALKRGAVAWIGVGSVGLALVAAVVAATGFWRHGAAPYTQTLYTWLSVAAFVPRVRFYLDGLSLVAMGVVTGVGFLIHLYSAEFMIDDEGYSRFFAYMNLFVAAMLILVLADNLLLLLLGWEGVGLASYLLIGFWYGESLNGLAARKAFIMTRLGDVAFVIGLLVLFNRLGTLNIQDLVRNAQAVWVPGSFWPTLAGALLLGGALGKSAQLPLQTWLPDAMAGPTPVSALIHAATMVTAGVYLVARLHGLYALAPAIERLIAVIGAVTLLLSAFAALVQSDIKRVLAYSTMSQIGYMFLANGVGAWSAAIFHFMIHAFFKALLFLAAGAVIQALHDEHDIGRMGGLRRQMPFTFWSFLIGGAALSAFPFITAGFYSKDLILWDAFASPLGGPAFWAAGLLGAFLTGLYTFRLIIRVFLGPAKSKIGRRPGWLMAVPIGVLALLSVVGGLLNIPSLFGGGAQFTHFLAQVLPAQALRPGVRAIEPDLETAAIGASLGGIFLAFLLFLHAPQWVEKVKSTVAGAALARWWGAGWGFDRLYEGVVARAYAGWARANRDDFVDSGVDGVVEGNRLLHQLLRWTQTGHVRWYAMAIALGAMGWFWLAVLS
ncbi:MAG: NADH-quinone oxidoreductase subunit L [Betaproteobacteria bacterium]|nr:NADH-quinone oxidoreductase subunit L [Betaproteobacteria bacterium]